MTAHLGPEARDRVGDEEEADWPAVGRRCARRSILYTSGSTGRAQGLVLSHARARVLANRVVGRARDGARPRGHGAGRPAPLAFLRPQRRAARPAAGPDPPSCLIERFVPEDGARRHRAPSGDGLARRRHHVSPAARLARAARRGSLEPEARGVGRGALSLGDRRGVAPAHRRAPAARLWHDRALPPDLVSRGRSARRAGRDRPARARRGGVPRRGGRAGRWARDEVGELWIKSPGRARRLPRRARGHAGGARGRLVQDGRSRHASRPTAS